MYSTTTPVATPILGNNLLIYGFLGSFLLFNPVPRNLLNRLLLSSHNLLEPNKLSPAQPLPIHLTTLSCLYLLFDNLNLLQNLHPLLRLIQHLPLCSPPIVFNYVHTIARIVKWQPLSDRPIPTLQVLADDVNFFVMDLVIFICAGG